MYIVSLVEPAELNQLIGTAETTKKNLNVVKPDSQQIL